VAVGGVLAYAVLSLVFVFRGRLNADEGWYLYAGRLVWRGNLPYRDFAFPQMPLTAYVYGLPQTIHASLTLGRVTSMVFGVAAVALFVRVAWRQAGPAAGAAVGLLLAAFPVGGYHLQLTKTYALTAVLLADVTAARYDLVTFHNLLWHGADPSSRAETIVQDRLPDWLGDYPGYVALLVAAVGAVFLSARLRAYLHRQPGVAIVGLAVL